MLYVNHAIGRETIFLNLNITVLCFKPRQGFSHEKFAVSEEILPTKKSLANKKAHLCERKM